MPPKKQNTGTSKTWKPMPISSKQQPRQASGRVYAGDTGTRGSTRRSEDPRRAAGIARTMGPAEKERDNMNAMANRGPTPDGRSPIRGRGVYGTYEPNEPTAAQLREPSRRPQRRRGDGSLTPPEVGE
jgi:hypothetical protein